MGLLSMSETHVMTNHLQQLAAFANQLLVHDQRNLMLNQAFAQVLSIKVTSRKGALLQEQLDLEHTEPRR